MKWTIAYIMNINIIFPIQRNAEMAVQMGIFNLISNVIKMVAPQILTENLQIPIIV